MNLQIPPLPPRSAIVVDEDEFKQLRLRWNFPHRSRYRKGWWIPAASILWLAVPTASLASVFIEENALQRAFIFSISWAWMVGLWTLCSIGVMLLLLLAFKIKASLPWPARFALHSMLIVSAGVVFVAVALGTFNWMNNGPIWYTLVAWACQTALWVCFGLFPPTLTYGVEEYPATIILTQAWLRYGTRDRAPADFPRWQISRIFLEPGEVRQKLLLDYLGVPFEIAVDLSDTDRHWLANVLQDWLRATEVADIAESQAVGPTDESDCNDPTNPAAVYSPVDLPVAE